MKEKKSVFPIGASHAPFWRAKGSDPSEWERDLRTMKEVGMTYVSVFASWHRIEREDNVFDFSDLDRLFSLAEKIGLKVSVGLGVHISYSIYPPRWIIRKYQGTKGMVDQFGVPDVEGTYIQPCFEEKEYRNYAERYFRTLVTRYAKNPMLAQWRVWGEATFEKFCYCETHRAMFRNYLEEKYGTIQMLNRAWGTEGPSDFLSFDEIYPPRKNSGRFYGFHECLDWQEFLDTSLTETVKRVSSWVRESDPLHPTLGEFWLPYSNSSGGGDDVWRLAQVVDSVGLSIYNKPVKNYALDMDLMNSAARLNDKEAWAIEVQGASRLFGWTEPSSPSSEQMTLWMWQLIAHGAKGVFFWTWRARFSDNEGGEFGMLRRDGSLPERTQKMSGEFALVQRIAPCLQKASRRAECAIFISREAEHLAAIDYVDKPEFNAYMHSVHSAYELLWRGGYPADFISTRNLDKLSTYKVLLLPFTFCIAPETVDAIREFVRNGGTVIADFMLGSKNTRGYCDRVIPGFGLSEIFGIREDEIFSAASVPPIHAGRSILKPFRFLQTCRNDKADVIATCGKKAVFTCNTFGKGKAIFLGTTFFHRDSWLKEPAKQKFFHRLLDDSGITVPVSFLTADRIQGEDPESILLKCGNGKHLVFLLNHSDSAVEGELRIAFPVKSVTDLRTGTTPESKQEKDSFRFRAAAQHLQCSIYLLETEGGEPS